MAGGLLQVPGSAGSARGQGQRWRLPKQPPDVAQPHANGHTTASDPDSLKTAVCPRSLGTTFHKRQGMGKMKEKDPARIPGAHSDEMSPEPSQ